MSVVLPIEDDPRFRIYVATAGQSQFAVNFPFQQDDDIVVALQSASGEFVPVVPTLYDTAGAGEPGGGMITFHAPRTEGDTLLVLGSAVLDRLGSVVRDGRFNSRLTDDEFDRNRIIQQELRRDVGTAVKVPYGAIGPLVEAPIDGRMLYWSLGDPLRPRISNGPSAEEMRDAAGYAQIAVDAAASVWKSAATFADRATAIAANVAAPIKRINLQAWENAISPWRGAAKYRESSAIEVAAHHARAWFTTNAGARYWLLDEAIGTAAMFGARGGASFGTTNASIVGADDLVALQAMVAFMRLTSFIGCIDDYHNISAQLDLNIGRPILGVGADRCGILSSFATLSSAVVIAKTGDGLCSMEVRVNPLVAKPENNGHLYACIQIGTQFFGLGNPVEIRDFTIDNIKLTRTSDAFGGHAISGIGYISGGEIGRVFDRGNPGTHSAAVQFHWGARGVDGFTLVEETFHCGNIRIKEVNVETCRSGVVLSAAYNVIVDRIVARNCRDAFIWLSGDETNEFAADGVAPGLVGRNVRALIGRGIRIREIDIQNPVNGSSFDLVHMTSLGASKYRTYPNGALWKRQLPIDIIIDSIVIEGAGLAKKGVNLFEVIGSVRFGTIDARNLGGACFEVNRSSARVDVEEVRSNTQARIISSKNVRIKRGGVIFTSITGASTGSDGPIYVAGAQFSTTLASNALAGATSVTLAGLIGDDMCAGDSILIGPHTMIVADFAEGSTQTVVNLTSGLPAAVNAPSTVVLDHRCDADICAAVRGGRVGIAVLQGDVRLSGKLSGQGQWAGLFRDGANVDILELITERCGLNRNADNALVSYDLDINANAKVRHKGGSIGRGSTLANFNVGVRLDTANDNNYIAMGVEFCERAAGGTAVTASSATDYKVVNCYEKTGVAVT